MAARCPMPPPMRRPSCSERRPALNTRPGRGRKYCEQPIKMAHGSLNLCCILCLDQLKLLWKLDAFLKKRSAIRHLHKRRLLGLQSSLIGAQPISQRFISALFDDRILFAEDPRRARAVVDMEPGHTLVLHLMRQQRRSSENFHALWDPDVELLGAESAYSDPTNACNNNVIPSAVTASKDLNTMPDQRSQLAHILLIVRREEKGACFPLHQSLDTVCPTYMQGHVNAEKGSHEGYTSLHLVYASKCAEQQ
mmetsp:Transcript_173922/g.557465  ORF Transcript_173922/g.557465 Transcript_173922/m.557465 type:complete len:251 (+) Transcript_173922:511-1263(+)